MLKILNKKIITQNEKNNFDDFDLQVSELLHTVLHSIPAFISFTIPETGVFRLVNDYAEQVLGYSREELIGHSAVELKLWANIEDRQKTLEQINLHGSVTNWEARFRKKDGTLIWGQYSVNKKSIGGQEFLVFNMQDVTHLYKYEKLSKIAENSLEGTIFFDEKFNVTYANRSALAMLGDDALGRNLAEIFQDNYNFIKQLYAGSSKDDLILEEEMFFMAANNVESYCKANIYRFFNSHDDTMGQAIQFKDITAQLQNFTYELLSHNHNEQTKRFKKDLVANVSHELRSPLHALIENSKAIATALVVGDYETAKTLNQHNISAASRLGKYQNEILNYAKLESGELNINTLPFALGEIAQHLGDLYRKVAEQKKLRLILREPPADIPEHLFGDQFILKQIIENLVGNAIHHTQHGQVEYFVKKIAQHDKQITLSFHIKDTGIGISAVDRRYIFEPYMQINGGGIGLGLAYVKKYVERLGGSIKLNSIPGRGSEFIVTLVFELAKGESSRESVTPQTIVAATDWLEQEYRILYVDDETIIRMGAIMNLRSVFPQATIDEAGDGAEAIAKHTANKYDVVIMDGNLGSGPDGCAVIKEIRQNDRDTLIVALSGYNTPDEFIAAGANEFLLKAHDNEARLKEVFYKYLVLPGELKN